jgi:hypothetical protein
MTYSKSVFTIEGDFPAVGLLVDGNPYFDAATTKSLIERHKANGSKCYWDDNQLVTFRVVGTNLISWDGDDDRTEWCGFQQDNEWYYPLGRQWDWSNVLEDVVETFLDKLKSELSHANQYWEMRVQQTQGDKWAPDSFCDSNMVVLDAWNHWFEEPSDVASQRHADVWNLICEHASERLLIKGWQWEHPGWEFQTEFQKDVMPHLEDYSWHNDTKPCFIDGDTGLIIWADHLDPKKREFPENSDTYTLSQADYNDHHSEGGPWEHADSPEILLETDDLSEVKQMIDDRRVAVGSLHPFFPKGE